MDEFLAFADSIGRTLDGGHIYRLDFTVDTETVWGEFFNVAPSSIVPNIQPDKNTLSHSCKAVFPRYMTRASHSYCFSMQDCIDGIMPLLFSEIDDQTLEYNDAPLFFNFGEPMELVLEKLKAVGIEPFDFEEVEKGDDSPIDKLIDEMDNNDIDDIDF